ncbi:hypothetical protein E4U44_008186 [Claviceps purpurea]|nr:hypothetical protein E4U44_008186 [Claviceps purpurea]
MTHVRRECGFNTGMIEVDLIIEFMQSDRSNFASTRAWLMYHQNLWKRINKIEKQSEGLWIAATIKAVEKSFRCSSSLDDQTHGREDADHESAGLITCETVWEGVGK